MGYWWLMVLAWDKTTKANNAGTSHLQNFALCAASLIWYSAQGLDHGVVSTGLSRFHSEPQHPHSMGVDGQRMTL